MSRYTVALYNAENLITAVASPTAVSQPTFTDEHNEIGSAGITVQLSDAEASKIDVDQILMFTLDGTRRFASPVDELTYASLAGSEGNRTLLIDGRGALALLEQAVIEPATGTGHLPVEEVRQFNWRAIDFDDSGTEWVAATEYATITEETEFWDPQDFPDYGEPDGTSVPKYIGPSTGDEDDAPEGDCYYRRTITTGDILFDIPTAADNFEEVYLDGVLILTSSTFGVTRHVEGGVKISAGDHVIAIRQNNYPDDGPPGGNPGMIVYTAVSLSVDGLIESIITFSGSLTKICEYPAAPPGMSVGAAMKTLIAEAQAATPPRLVGVTIDFDETVDSNGEDWNLIPDLSGRVGDDLLTFVRQLIDSGYCDVRMTPGLVFQMFKPGTLGGSSTAAPGFTTVTHRKVSAPVTSALVKWRDTYTAYESAAEPAKRALLRLEQAPSAESAFAIAQAVVDARSSALVAVAATIDAGVGPNVDEPYGGVEGTGDGIFPGDTLPVPMIDGSTSAEKVQAITFSIDAAGNPRWTLDIKDRILAAERAAETVEKRMLGGALGGQSNTPSFLNSLGQSQGTQYRLTLVDATFIPEDEPVLESPEKQVNRTADLFWLKVRLDEIQAVDVTVSVRINTHTTPIALEVTVPAGDQLGIAWLAVGTTKVTTSDWFTIATDSAPCRITATVAFR